MHFLFNLILVVEKVITHHHRLQTNCSLDYLAASEAFSLMREWRGLYLKNVETNYPPSMLTLTQQWPRCVWRCDTGKFELHSNSLFHTQDNRSSCVKSENRVQHNERHEQLLVPHPSLWWLCAQPSNAGIQNSYKHFCHQMWFYDLAFSKRAEIFTTAVCIHSFLMTDNFPLCRCTLSQFYLPKRWFW